MACSCVSDSEPSDIGVEGDIGVVGDIGIVGDTGVDGDAGVEGDIAGTGDEGGVECVGDETDPSSGRSHCVRRVA